MDEEVTRVDRREAVAGISLLGLLLLAVAGSTAYRIVQAPQHRNPATYATVSPPAPDSVAPADSAGSVSSAQIADAVSKATSEPETAANEPPQGIAAKRDAAVQPTTLEQSPVAETPASPPRFVAPSQASQR